MGINLTDPKLELRRGSRGMALKISQQMRPSRGQE